jgi:hypothetical protein
MKKIIFGLTVFLILFGMAGGAGAAMVDTQWTDVWTPEGGSVYFASPWADSGGYSIFSYQHSILEDGFIPGQDSVSDYNLTIGLRDDRDRWWSEAAIINLPGLTSDRIVEVDFSDIIAGSSFAGLFSLNENGILNVTIARWWGDFFLTGSTLVADGQTPASAPIPAAVLLLGSGLIGLLGLRRAAGA